MRRKRPGRYSRAGLREADSRELMAEACLRYVGNDEYYGQPFALEPWQRDNVWRPVFASGKADRRSGRFVRRYRRALIGEPRGLGKTALATAMLLSEATMAPVMNGEYGLVADSRDNARKAYQYLTSMVRLSPDLSKAWRVYRSEVRNAETGAWVRIFPNDVGAVQGYHFNMAILDELHVYRDDELWNAVISGQERVPNALTVGITTASGRRSGFLWDLYSRIAPEDPACWLYWLGLDDGDDPDDERNWAKLMVTDRITMDQLRGQRAALTKRAFQRYQLNQFPADMSDEAFFAGRDIGACRRVVADIDPHRFAVAGLDGAVNGDTLGLVLYQATEDGRDAFRSWAWDRPVGALGTYDLTDVADVLAEIALTHDDVLFVADPARLSFLANWLERERGIVLWAFNQTPGNMCPASEALGRSVRAHRAAFRGNALLADHCAAAVVSESKAYGRRLSSRRHGQGTDRIDLAVAAAMAMKAYDDNLADHQGGATGFVVDL